MIAALFNLLKMKFLVFVQIAITFCGKLCGFPLNSVSKNSVLHSDKPSQLPIAFKSQNSVSIYYRILLDIKSSHFDLPKGKYVNQGRCPVVWEANVQEDRIPRVIMTAKCPNNKTEMVESGIKCGPVTYAFTVLRKYKCLFGMYIYREDRQYVNTTCLASNQYPEKTSQIVPQEVGND